VADAFLPHLTDIQYRNFFHTVVAETFGENYWNALGGEGAAVVNAAWSIEDALVRVINELIFHGNFWQADRTQLYDVASNTDQLVVNSAFALQSLRNIDQNIFLLAQQDFTPDVTINLDVLKTPLDSLNNNVATIMRAVAGGSDVGFSHVVAALVDENITAQNFLVNFDGHMRVLESQLSELAAAGAGDDLSKAVLEVGTYTAKQQDTQNVVANAFAAADLTAQQKLADNTLDAARLNFISTGAPILAGMPGAETLSGFLSSLSNGEAMSRLLDTMESGVALAPDVIMSKDSRDEWARFFKTARETGFLSAWKQSTVDVVKAVADFASPSVKSLFGLIGTIAEAFEPALKGIFQPAFDNMLGVVKARVSSQGEVLPTTGFEAAGEWLSAAASAGMHAHHLAELLEMIPYTKTFGLNMLPAFLSDMAGFGGIAQQTWGKAIGEGVGRPAMYEINALMRSRLPDERLLDEALIRRKMNIGEYKVLNAFNGYRDDYIDLKADTAWRRPTLREILQLVQDSSVTEEDLTFFLRDAGHRDEFIQKILPIVLHKRAQAKEASLISEVIANLREGFISEEDAQLYFDSASMSNEERNIVLATARLAFRRGRMADNLATLQNEFTNNLMEASDFTLAARAQGISEARIASELFSIEVKRNGTVAHQEAADAKAEVRKQQSLVLQEFRVLFQHGLVDANEFERALEQSGILPATARLTVELEQVKLEGRAGTAKSAAAARLTAKEIKLREDTFVEMFRKGIISNLQLENSLRQLGLSDSIVSATVQKELAARILTAADLLKTPAALKAKELFTLAKSTLQVEFAKGAIDADQYLQQLVLLGVDETVARATVKLEVASAAARSNRRKRPPPIRRR
jgi:hypothetical protein